MKMATLEEEKTRRTAIQYYVQTVMTSIDSFKHLKSTNIYSGISRSLVLNGMVDLDMSEQKNTAWTKPFMNVPNVLSADEIASSV